MWIMARSRWVWWGIWGVVLWLIFGGLIGVWAQEDPPGWIPLPGPEHDPAVMLQAFAVDLFVEERDPQPVLKVIVRFRLLNTGTTEPAQAQLMWTGTAQNGGTLPPLRLGIGTDPSAAQPYAETTFTRELRPDERLWLTLTYTETLPATPWTALVYSVERLHEWPVTVGSVRVTLHLPQLLDQRAMLSVAPDPSRYDGEVWEWQWENVVPPQAVSVLFIRPEWWARLETWRAQVQEGDITTATRLARVLTQGVLDPQAPEAVANAFYPEALALWTQIAEARPDDPEPWRQMANLYAAQAATSPQADAYRSLMVAALEAAWRRGDRDAALQAELADAVEAQARSYANARRWEEAWQQVAVLDDLLGTTAQERVRTLRRDIALAWALDRLEAGDEAGFQEAIASGWGESMLGFFLPQRPALRYVGVDVMTTDITRTITLMVTLDPQTRPSTEEMWAAVEEWLRTQIPEGRVVTQREGYTMMARLTFAYTSPSDILRIQERIVEGLPETPAWALVRAALQPQLLRTSTDPKWWGTQQHWQEVVNLGPARRALDEAISQVDMSLTLAANADLPAALVPILRQRREEDRQAWVALRDYSDVVFRYRWQRSLFPPLYRRWHLNAGEQALMAMSWAKVVPSRLAGLGVLVLLGWTVGTWGLWRWLGRS